MPNIFGFSHGWETRNAEAINPLDYKNEHDYIAAYLSASGMGAMSNPVALSLATGAAKARYGQGWQNYNQAAPQRAAEERQRVDATTAAGNAQANGGPPPPAIASPPGANGVSASGSSQKDLEQMIRDFIAEMSAPLNMNDARVQQLMTNSSHSAALDAKNRGITGPMSVGNTQRATIQAQVGYQQQRDQARQAAMGQLGAVEGQRTQADLDRAKLQYTADLNRYQAEQTQRERNNPWNLLTPVLGVAGGALGGLATAGNPMGIAAGAGVGAGAGAGLSQMMMPYQPPPAYNAPAPRYGGSGYTPYTPYGSGGHV